MYLQVYFLYIYTISLNIFIQIPTHLLSLTLSLSVQIYYVDNMFGSGGVTLGGVLFPKYLQVIGAKSASGYLGFTAF